MTDALRLEGRGLTPAEVASVARDGRGVALGPKARADVGESHAALLTACAHGDAIYGATTGVGALDDQRIGEAESESFQASLLMSHAAGVGDAAPAARVRAMMVVRASQLAMGRSGISPATLEALIAMVDRGVVPRVPGLGSVGASDLAPLAHAALPLIGQGSARHGGRSMKGGEALASARIARPKLVGRDALAWINAPADAVGLASLAVVDAARVLSAAEVAAALTMAALKSHTGAFDRRAIAVKPLLGAVASAEHLRLLLPGAETKAREPLCIRCTPYVIGAGRDALEALREIVRVELAAPTDNPVWQGGGSFPADGAAFDTHRLAQLLDGLADALTSVAVSAERRIDRLVDPTKNGGLPAFLVGARGASARESSGFMIAQYTAVSLVARMRGRVAGSVLGAPTCAGFEDAVSMAPLSADRATDALRDASRVVAIELLAAAQAVDLGEATMAARLSEHHRAVRAASPFAERDRAMGEEIDALADAIRFGALDAIHQSLRAAE